MYAGTTSDKLINPALANLPARVYVPHELGGDVAVIDPASMQVIDRFFVGRTPHHVGPAPDMSSLMVNVMDSNRLAVIDIHSGRVAQSASTPEDTSTVRVFRNGQSSEVTVTR